MRVNAPLIWRHSDVRHAVEEMMRCFCSSNHHRRWRVSPSSASLDPCLSPFLLNPRRTDMGSTSATSGVMEGIKSVVIIIAMEGKLRGGDVGLYRGGGWGGQTVSLHDKPRDGSSV